MGELRDPPEILYNYSIAGALNQVSSKTGFQQNGLETTLTPVNANEEFNGSNIRVRRRGEYFLMADGDI